MHSACRCLILWDRAGVPLMRRRLRFPVHVVFVRVNQVLVRLWARVVAVSDRIFREGVQATAQCVQRRFRGSGRSFECAE